MCIVQLDVDTPLAHTRHVALENLTNLVVHKLDHLILDRCALGLRSDNLALGGIYTLRLNLGLIGRLTLGQVTRQQTMHHHIGIAADRRRKVSIVFESQAIVADIIGCIERLRHTSHGQRRDSICLGTATNLAHQLIYRLSHSAALRCAELITKTQDKVTEAREFLLVGLVVNTVNHRTRHLLAIDHSICAILRHLLVSQEHKLLDKLV